jgi:hypothetical protein
MCQYRLQIKWDYKKFFFQKLDLFPSSARQKGGPCHSALKYVIRNELLTAVAAASSRGSRDLTTQSMHPFCPPKDRETEPNISEEYITASVV